MTKSGRGLLFGIYPGSGVSEYTGPGSFSGPKDVPEKINEALDLIQTGGIPLLIRSYTGFEDAFFTPSGIDHFLSPGRKLDIAVCYRSKKYHKDKWLAYLHGLIKKYGKKLYKIQITEEPNNPDASMGGDGSSDRVLDALVDGVIAAKEYAMNEGTGLLIGFNAVISFNQADKFWSDLSSRNTPPFLNSLDYVGLDFYPDVFRTLPPGMSIGEAVSAVISQFRAVNLKQAGIPDTVPLHITENGWPTSPGRSEEKQALYVRELIDNVVRLSEEHNITCYEYFDLRDADSSSDGFRFGLMNDDYTQKPAFRTFCEMVEKHSATSF